MRKQYIRWILPIIALLIIATVVVLSPLVVGHTGVGSSTVPTAAPASPYVRQNGFWNF